MGANQKDADSAYPQISGVTGGLVRFRGGLNRQIRWGRLNASVPLAVLCATPETLALSLVRPVGWFIGPVTLQRVEGVEIWINSPGSWLNSGLVIKSALGDVYFFWSRRPEIICGALAGLGYVIHSEDLNLHSWDRSRI